MNLSLFSPTSAMFTNTSGIRPETNPRHLLSTAPVQRVRMCRRQTYSVLVIAATAKMGIEENMGPKSRMTLQVNVPKDLCMETYNEVLREMGKEARIPGFRAGKKVTPTILVGHYGLKNVKAAVLDALLNRALPEALAAVAEKALDESESIETEMEKMLEAFQGPVGQPTDDLLFSVGVDLVPEIRWKSSYKDIKVTVQAKGNANTIQKDADSEFRSRWKDLGTLRVVPNRGLEKNDVAVIDLEACLVNEDGSVGKEIPGVNNKNFRFDTSEGDGFLPGLVEAVVGMRTGETKEFDLTFPEDWYIESMAGCQGRFTTVLKELFWRELPELSDSLAPQLLKDCTSIEQVKANLLTSATDRTEQATESVVHEALTNAIAEIVEADLPDSLVIDQGRQNYSVRMLELLQAGQITKDVLNTMMSEEMVANYLEHQRDDVERVVRLTLGVGEIQRLESLEVDEAELEKEVKNSEAEFAKLGQECDPEKVREQAKELLEGALVLDWLKSTCEVTITPYESSETEGATAQESINGAVVYKFD